VTSSQGLKEVLKTFQTLGGVTQSEGWRSQYIKWEEADLCTSLGPPTSVGSLLN